MSQNRSSKKSEFVWGADAISDAIGETRRATYHKLERGVIPGARKFGGTWCLNVPAFRKAFEQNRAA